MSYILRSKKLLINDKKILIMNAKIRIYCTFLLLAIITNTFNCGRSTRTSLSTADDKLELVGELPSDFESNQVFNIGSHLQGVGLPAGGNFGIPQRLKKVAAFAKNTATIFNIIILFT